MNKKIPYILFLIFYSCCCKQQASVKEELYIMDVVADEKFNANSMAAARSSIEAFYTSNEDTVIINKWYEEFEKNDSSIFEYKKNNKLIEDSLDFESWILGPPPPPVKTIVAYKFHKEVDNGNLKIIILDRRKISIELPTNDTTFSLFEAYPVLVKNTTDSLISLDLRGVNLLYMVQQAKDKNGHWKEVEFSSLEHSCTNGPRAIEILPNQGFITNTPVYQGDFKTEIRVKLFTNGSIYYSNSIKGSVNESQFKLPNEFNGIAPENLKNLLISKRK